MTAIDEAELDELERLCAEATPGPWVIDSGQYCPEACHYGGPQEYVYVMGERDHYVADCWCEGAPQDKPNARLIAAARNALPALIAEVRRLRGEQDCARVAELEAELDESQYDLEAQRRACDAAERDVLTLCDGAPFAKMPDGWRERLEAYRKRHGR